VIATDRERRWRLLAAALALGAASSHFALSVVNLIPGESTEGPLFAAMGAGFVVVAVFVLLRKPLLDRLAALYDGVLLLAYIASRLPIDTPLPIEPIGVATVIVEAMLLVVLVLLIRAPRGPSRPNS